MEFLILAELGRWAGRTLDKPAAIVPPEIDHVYVAQKELLSVRSNQRLIAHMLLFELCRGSVRMIVGSSVVVECAIGHGSDPDPSPIKSCFFGLNRGPKGLLAS